MTFISYAQNYEDVMLYRALKGVEKGFYIDVGAMSPVVESVTKAFYERGWRGINIEPVYQWYEKLVLDRPEDINLNVAISDKAGVVHLYDIADTGLSTFDRVLAERHKEERGYQIRDITVPALTLDTILEEHLHEEIHFLKVDVEGAERQVLGGINLKRTRPWIILVEATKPNTQEQDYDTWEHLITEQSYVFTYFDGLNRFYLAQERSELLPAFNTPPNLFDDFIKISEHNVQAALNAKETERQQVEAALNAKETERQQVEAALNAKEVKRQRLQAALSAKEVERQGLQAALNAKEAKRQGLEAALNAKGAERDAIKAELQHVYNSRSFRITAPMRAVFGTVRILRNKLLRPNNHPDSTSAKRAKANLKKIIRQGVNFLRRIPWVAILLYKFKNRFPRLWIKAASFTKKIIREKDESLEHIQSLVIDLSSSEDEKHFLNLFQCELSKRQQKNIGVK